MKSSLTSDFLCMYEQDTVWDNRSAVWPNLSREPLWQRDLIASRLIPVIGESEALLPRGTLSDELFRFLSASGFVRPKNAILYDNEPDRMDIIMSFARASRQIAIQMPAPYQDIPAAAYAIDRELLLYLNNKSNLHRLLPEKLAAPRLKTSPAALRSGDWRPLKWPVLLKAGLGQPSMGGDDVFVCHNEATLLRIINTFPMDARIIIEPWLEYERNLCVQLLVGEAEVRFLGAAAQIIENDTAHVGNIVRPFEPVPEPIRQALRMACIRAQDLGFRGVAGFDVLLDSNASAWVIDANFRINGSTTALLLAADKDIDRTMVLESYDVSRDDQVGCRTVLMACERGELKVLASSLDEVTNRIKLTILRAETFELPIHSNKIPDIKVNQNCSSILA